MGRESPWPSRRRVGPSWARAALLALPMVTLATPSGAAQRPRPSLADPRIKHVDYNPLEVVELTGVYRSALQVVFAANETIVHVALGDSLAWEVAPAGNLLFLKPREHHPPTNLIVTTERPGASGPESRTYAFELRIRGGAISAGTPATAFQVRFAYPEDEASRKRAEALAEVNAKAQSAARTLVDLELGHAVLEGPRNFRYEVQGAPELQPSEISDNGVFTVMRFAGSEPLPAIFAVGTNGTERLVAFDVRGQFVVIHEVTAGFRLRRNNAVLCVYNEARSPWGVDPGTGTASSHVVRTLESAPAHANGGARGAAQPPAGGAP